jgi:hypothetical protein
MLERYLQCKNYWSLKGTKATIILVLIIIYFLWKYAFFQKALLLLHIVQSIIDHFEYFSHENVRCSRATISIMNNNNENMYALLEFKIRKIYYRK